MHERNLPPTGMLFCLAIIKASQFCIYVYVYGAADVMTAVHGLDCGKFEVYYTQAQGQDTTHQHLFYTHKCCTISLYTDKSVGINLRLPQQDNHCRSHKSFDVVR